MIRAYVIINTDLGSDNPEIAKRLATVSGVKEVSQIYRGVYDIFARVEAGTEDEIKGIVNNHIRKADEITGTMILFCRKGFYIDEEGFYRNENDKRVDEQQSPKIR